MGSVAFRNSISAFNSLNMTGEVSEVCGTGSDTNDDTPEDVKEDTSIDTTEAPTHYRSDYTYNKEWNGKETSGDYTNVKMK